ncbi:MAG: hypothetical protein CO118_05435 [Flavobacteriales bacterium CG_4_9_14_3_um_filter_32_8]|nr:MAG: hypothetical protein CO118_05435 [Flavobacteriales bacterium CG_4_9_14_3_um_filter_32_8]
MKKLTLLYPIILYMFFTSCIVVDNTPGTYGRDGKAYFGVDYEHHAPYSYWDNNNAIPNNPILGEYYPTNPGIYDFEYYVNSHDYWYGTYEIWINRGGAGGAHGEPGYDGLDTYLMLICDPNGFHEHGYRLKENEPLIIENKSGKYNYKIMIQKGNILTRPTQQPKYIQN